MSSTTKEFIQLMKHPVKFRMFLFFKLPAAFFSGVRIKDIDEGKCIASIPYKWFSQNPFRSTYFACLAMAAEMTTGSLGMMHIRKRKPAVSMLVVKLEAVYFKKATGLTIFTCTDGEQLKATIEKAIATGEGQSFTALSAGVNEQGEKIADFFITWSFKARTK
ncbi:MAG TPA: DUF4442 domain-containing protein [Chitinophagaceae bacterium]|nr:DUF4442 domain-containing protein [Chitinophagaceae bacterium]